MGEYLFSACNTRCSWKRNLARVTNQSRGTYTPSFWYAIYSARSKKNNYVFLTFGCMGEWHTVLSISCPNADLEAGWVGLHSLFFSVISTIVSASLHIPTLLLTFVLLLYPLLSLSVSFPFWPGHLNTAVWKCSTFSNDSLYTAECQRKICVTKTSFHFREISSNVGVFLPSGCWNVLIQVSHWTAFKK